MASNVVHRLFNELARAIPLPYPEGVVPVPEQIQGTAFFPGGTGLWVDAAPELPPMPVGGVMVLGHDFHSVAGYQKSLAAGAESLKSPTWSRLLELLDRIPIQRSACFFTNIYMGLREDEKSTGPFPGAKSPEFVTRCRDFLLLQIAMQRPSVMLSLGAHVPQFLAPLSPQLTGWAAPSGFKQWDEAGTAIVSDVSFGVPRHQPCTVVALVHPSSRPLHVGRRRWGTLTGDEAEVALVREALGRLDPARRAEVEGAK